MPLQRAATSMLRRMAHLAVALAGLLVLTQALAAPNPVSGAKKDEFQTPATHVILMDAESGSILFEKNGDQLMAPSSLAQLTTSEFVFNELKPGPLSRDAELIVTEDAWRPGGAPPHTTRMFAPVDSQVAEEDVIYGMIIQPGDDPCMALAEGVVGSEQERGERMT